MSSVPPTVRWVSASISKRGNRSEENEDAIVAFPAKMRFAISDGATEGWESRKWAVCLAKAFAQQPPTPADFPAWLATTQSKWHPSREAGPVSWFAEMKQEEGSFATLVGIEFRFNEKQARWAWKAVAVGDSCLFQVRGGCLQQVFPISTPDGFGSNPQLVPSLPALTCPEPEWLAGQGQPLDLFLLATDAVAAHLVTLKTPEDWSPVLAAVEKGLPARDRDPILEWFPMVQAIKNDDVSMVAIQILGTSEPPA
jgi:hypothetical protein